MAAEYRVGIDWDGDGTTTGVGEDVTARVLGHGGVSIAYGRDQARMLAPMSPGEANLVINNESGDYSPENTGSPLYGTVIPGRAVEITATLAGTDHTLYRGHLDDYEVLPDLAEQRVRLSCLDPLGRLRGQRVSTGLYESVQTGTAVGLLLDAVGWPSDLRDLDYGATTVPWWWCAEADVYEMLTQLVDSEGPGAMAAVGPAGELVFRSRHHRLLRAESTTVQATWRGSGAEPHIAKGMKYEHGWRDIVNTVTVQVPIRALADEAVVWQASGQLVIADGQTIPVSAAPSNPVAQAVTPVADQDYTATGGTVTIVLSRDSGQAITMYITAVGGTVTLADLQLRARPLVTQSTVQVSAEETVSVGRYGRRSLPSARDPVWAGVNDAAAIADLILAQRAERLPTVTVTMVGATDTRLAEILGRDLGDRVRIVADPAHLDADFYIEHIAHSITGTGAEHRTTFGCERIPEPISDVLILDDPVMGLLGVGRLGGIAQSEPGTLFILDDPSTGRLDVGLLGY